ncbi:hypothetical protein P3T76_004261 [Phytophthora citrophthora]|uniref:Uncharacterized protein n=1 Tax=Phytophthora citrophthora TaxID=4793 RepID=A0AAD9LRQ8_9STRA|nr:hypothetical protein P3T76_004261 [Phytophthora citrophthora]
MRSPTKLRTPTKLVRPRETHWASKTKDVKKRLLEGYLDSALPAPKRIKLSHQQSIKQPDSVSISHGVSNAGDSVEASQQIEEEEYTGSSDGLDRQVEVAQCLEKDLLRDNARMKLKVLGLRDEVDFYYGILARIELVAVEKRRESESASNQERETVKQLVEKLQRIISASKPVETSEKEMEDDEREKE